MFELVADGIRIIGPAVEPVAVPLPILLVDDKARCRVVPERCLCMARGHTLQPSKHSVDVRALLLRELIEDDPKMPGHPRTV